jgi:hypothetical protein
MQPTKEFTDDIYRERILRARRTPPGQKLRDGAILFDEVCERMKAGIRSQFPDADASRVTEILRERVNRLRKREEHGIYFPVETPDDQ